MFTERRTHGHLNDAMLRLIKQAKMPFSASRAGFSDEMIPDVSAECWVMVGYQVASGQAGKQKGPGLAWKLDLHWAEMIKYFTFKQSARGCLDICCALCSDRASLNTREINMHTSCVLLATYALALWWTHIFMYLNALPLLSSLPVYVMPPESILLVFPQMTGQL